MVGIMVPAELFRKWVGHFKAELVSGFSRSSEKSFPLEDKENW